MEREALLQRIKEVVRGFDPEAEIILYGSRARGDATKESDWDLLVLYTGPENKSFEQELCDALYDVELEADEVVTPIIHDRDYWRRPLTQAMPFYREVARDGVTI
ncbi:MAG: nucleotidyltransferase domain-containing protein [Candidatus Hydrogenedentota bacterium]